jgi:hypothetical protein
MCNKSNSKLINISKAFRFVGGESFPLPPTIMTKKRERGEEKTLKY